MARNYLKDHRIALGACLVSTVLFISSISFFAFVHSSFKSYICPSSGLDCVLRHTQNSFNDSYDKVGGIGAVNYNQNLTLCDFIAQFEVFNSAKIVSVCVYQGNTRVDIREFYQGEPSIRGVWFSVNEWKNFIRLVYDITEELVFEQFV